jgi:hypothetical protein
LDSAEEGKKVAAGQAAGAVDRVSGAVNDIAVATALVVRVYDTICKFITPEGRKELFEDAVRKADAKRS